VYALYPVMLILLRKVKFKSRAPDESVDEISLIYLSHNGKPYLQNKISVLLEYLRPFQKWELIIIDDCSEDGSKDVLKSYKNTNGIQIIQKNEQKGIPHSMNLAVESALYKNIVFCDQRQEISGNNHLLKELIIPLIYEDIGAVSACISPIDKSKKFSLLRKYENFIKSLESRNGNLIGVYGPLYAVKKELYSPLPENIILDDLYLSLGVLKSKRIILLPAVEIFDDNFSFLYDYKRIKRYLEGFFQILQDRSLVKGLGMKQFTMLLWHKYVRLFIPVMLLMSYIGSVIMIFRGTEYLIVCGILTALILISFLPCKYKIQFRLKNFIRINFLYVFATSDILLEKVLSVRRSHADS